MLACRHIPGPPAVAPSSNACRRLQGAALPSTRPAWWCLPASPVTGSSRVAEVRAQSLAAPPARGARSPTSVVEKHEYRRNVGVCLVNAKGLVFAARRVDDKHNTWQMPQGGIDVPENPMLAAKRELFEETGISSAKILKGLDPWLHYDFPTTVRSQLTGEWLRYRGQTQKWFLLYFYGDDSEIDLSHHGEPEFSEYRWMRIEDLPCKVVDFKRAVYERVAREFAPIIAQLPKEPWYPGNPDERPRNNAVSKPARRVAARK